MLSKREIKYFSSLPSPIKKIYYQTNDAYDCHLYLLASIGVRAILEAILEDKLHMEGHGLSLLSKIDRLKTYFGHEVLSTLHDLRFLGNKAVHSLEEQTGLELHYIAHLLS